MVLVAGLIVSALPGKQALAAANNIEPRSLTLSSSAPAASANDLFSFTLGTAESVGSIEFQYCTNANIDIGGACTVPTGLSTASATIGTQTGTNFASINTTTAGAPYVYSSSALSITANEAITIQLKSVTNQDATNCGGSSNCTFYVRITTYAATNATGTALDAGTVAAATSTQIVLTGTMPETLIFCTGQTVSENGNGIPDCTTATSGDINFDGLFSPTSTTYASSQMAASTNAASGYAITLSGATLTSGGNTIKAIGSTPTLSTIGTAQFGLNLVDDSDTLNAPTTLSPASAAITPASNGSNLMGAANANFATGGAASAAKYAFNDTGNNTVAASDYGHAGTGSPTDAQIYTTTYMVNVSGSQAAGTYKTTLTYICTATY